jgi:hypothetical protein
MPNDHIDNLTPRMQLKIKLFERQLEARDLNFHSFAVHSDGERIHYYQEVKGRKSFSLETDNDFDSVPDWLEFVRLARMCGLESSLDKIGWVHWKDNSWE